MNNLNYTYMRQNLAKVMDQVNDDQAPILVTRQSGKPVVVMSLEEFNALEETAHLLRGAANAQRLIESTAQLRRGEGRTVALPLDDDGAEND